MNKKLLLFTMLIISSMVQTKKPINMEEELTKSGQVIAATLFKPITATSIKNGLKIDKPGSYVLAVPTTIPSSGSSQESGTVNGSGVTNGAIVITANDVTLNLNNYPLQTDLAGIVAIYINDDVSGTIIENGNILSGTSAWDSAIIVGRGCSDVTIRNININSCADDGIFIKGANGSHCTSVNIEDVTILRCVAASGASSSGIEVDYTDSLQLDNVTVNSSSGTSSSWYSGIFLNNCTGIKATNVEASNHSISAGSGLYPITIESCNDIHLEDVYSLQNSNTSSGDTNYGIYIYDCKNVTGKNIRSQGHSSAGESYGVHLYEATNVNLIDLSVSNNTTTSTSDYTSGLYAEDCNLVTATNVDASNNSGTSDTRAIYLYGSNGVTVNNSTMSNCSSSSTKNTVGIYLRDTQSIIFNNFEINNLSNAQYGIFCNDTENKNISFNNGSINNCEANTSNTFYGVYLDATAHNVYNLKMTNCSISNNTSKGIFHGIYADAVNQSDLLFDSIEILNNNSTAGDLYGFNIAATTETKGVSVNNCNVEHNSTATGGATPYTLHGLDATATTENLSISNSSFSYNDASYVATARPTGGDLGNNIAGVYVASVNGLSIKGCKANENLGPAQAFGFYVSSIDQAEILNCDASRNTADTFTTPADINADGLEALPTAGFYLLSCNYCTIDGCSAMNNKAGDYSTGAGGSDLIELTTMCAGFGFMNIGTSNAAKSTGNNYNNCIANGNQTQLEDTAATVAGSAAAYAATSVTSTANYTKRYLLSENAAGGFAAQWSENTEFYNCTANNNGNNPFVIAYGFLVCNATTSNQSKQINITQCRASNNQYFGFVDTGAFQSSEINSETTLFANYASMNGEHNLMLVDASGTEFDPPGAPAAGDMDGHLRNYWLYFSNEGQDIPIKRISYGGQGMAQIPGNNLFNISMAKDA